MDEQKIYNLLTRLTGRLAPNSGEELVQQCWDVLVDGQRDAEYKDYTDLEHVSTAIFKQLEDPQQGASFANLVNRLADLQDQGVLRRPAEMVHFLRFMSNPIDPEEKELNEQVKHMGLHRIPSRMDDEPEGLEEGIDEGMEGEGVRYDGAGDIIRQLHDSQSPNNGELLEDLPYALQGVTTAAFAWHDIENKLQLPGTIPFPLMGLLNQLLEPALLYRYLIVHTVERDVGLVKQSLNSAVHDELQSYLTLVGVVENQVRRQAASIDTRVTLRRCVVLLQEATLGLRLLYSIIQESKDKQGGQILSLMHSYSYNGDTFISKFATRLIAQISCPFYEILNEWVGSGNLVDPHGEFFVTIQDPKSSWEGRFSCDVDKVPTYMSNSVANKVLEIGKTLYFLRTACDDAAWVDLRRTTIEPVRHYHDLENSIQQSYAKVVERLNTVLRENFLLDLHLQGLKDYLMLGKGDFVQVLVETVAPVLDRSANTLLRHHLTSTLETAIRGSNAQFDNEHVLSSLDARMLELGHGDIGWDVFTLDYRVEKPLDVVILNRAAMTEYLRVFNFLWRVKRVSYSLYVGWRRLATGHRRVLSKNRDVEFNKQWHEVRTVYQEMMHFICEMQYYINYEVVEMAWSELQRKLKPQSDVPLTVDEIIKAHQTYLAQITHKGLLGGGNNLMGELHEILKMMLSFRESIDALYDTSVRLQMTTDQTLQPRFDTITSRIGALKQQFEKSVSRLVRELAKQDDSEMRFLSVRLDFNGFYSSSSKVYY